MLLTKAEAAPLHSCRSRVVVLCARAISRREGAPTKACRAYIRTHYPGWSAVRAACLPETEIELTDACIVVVRSPSLSSVAFRNVWCSVYSFIFFFRCAEQLNCGDFGFALMTDEEMLACFQDADVCVMAADYAEVRTNSVSYTCVAFVDLQMMSSHHEPGRGAGGGGAGVTKCRHGAGWGGAERAGPSDGTPKNQAR